jgi:predicted nucleotidyltransferase
VFEGYGFPYHNNLLMAYIGGSQAHGAKVAGTDDTDWYGVFVEPPGKALGIDRFEHFVYTTGGKVGGNGPNDIDICLYSLRKWAGLAAKGNPSSLHFLFAPLQFHTYWWLAHIKMRSDLFLSRNHVRPFLGFADDQMKRLFGEKGQKNVHRKESEEKFGYDTKYAMHVIRLYGEAKELMETGNITLPRPNAAELIAIREGKYKLSDIRTMGRDLEADALAASDRSPLPAGVDREKISSVIAEVYRRFWDQQEERR